MAVELTRSYSRLLLVETCLLKPSSLRSRRRKVEALNPKSTVCLLFFPPSLFPLDLITDMIRSRKIDRPDGTAYACGATDSSPLPSHASKVMTDPSAISSILNHTSLLSPSHLSTDNGEHSAQVVRSQACYLPIGSGDPVLGQIEGSLKERKGVYVASGHSCWGICNGTFNIPRTRGIRLTL